MLVVPTHLEYNQQQVQVAQYIMMELLIMLVVLVQLYYTFKWTLQQLYIINVQLTLL